MNENHELPEDLRELIDTYIDGTIDADGMKTLEAQLAADAEVRRYFVRYARLDTDLALQVRAQVAGERALQTIDQAQPSPMPRRYRRLVSWSLPLAAAALLLAISTWIVWRAVQGPAQAREELAWLINAQNCQWA